MKINCTFFLIFTFFCLVLSCRKKNDCSQNMQIIGPDSVNEGEEIQLNIKNPIPEKTNTYYYWNYPDMSHYYSLVDNFVEVDYAEPAYIEKARVTDEGQYTFKVISKECGTVTVSKNIKVIPLVSPCFNSTFDNQLDLTKSNSPIQVFQKFTPILHDNLSDFYIELKMPMFTYTMNLYFYKSIPVKSSRYLIRNRYQNAFDDQIPKDEDLHVYIDFATASVGYDYYRVDEALNNLYLKREGNQMIISFCDVAFKGKYNDSIVVSGKVNINL